MNLLKKILIANLVAIIIPFVVYVFTFDSITDDGQLIGGITILLVPVIPLALLLLFFCKDYYKEPSPSKSVLLRNCLAGLIWISAVALNRVFLDFQFEHRTYLNIIFSFETLVSYAGLIAAVFNAVWFAVFLNLAVVISHCPTRKPAELSNKQI